MKPSSCSIVGLRNTGPVSRMKSFQNWPGSSSVSAGGVSRISRSSKPFSSSVPANDSSITNTTRCPRRLEHLADADAVVGRPVGPLGEEDDGRHYSAILRRATQTSSLGHFCAQPRFTKWRSSSAGPSGA